MKNFGTIFSLILFCFSCNSLNPVKGTGKLVTQARDVENFTKIDVSGSIDVHIKQGLPASVKVTADDNVINDLVTKVESGELNIRQRPNTSFRNATMEVYIVTPEISAISTAASAEVETDGSIKNAAKISFSASSSSSIKAKVDAPTIFINTSSSAEAIVAGRGKSLQAKSSSSSTVMADKLLVETADVSASSSADINIFASVQINAKASSSGSILYSGSPNVKSKTSSSGTINKKMN